MALRLLTLVAMTAKLLQWVGGLGILAALAAVAGGFAVLKDRVRVVIAADQVATGPDPVALLRDDVATLRTDLQQLQEALGQNFERLAQALDGPAALRHQDVVELRREVAAVASRQSTLDANLQQVARALPALEARLGALLAAAASAPAATSPPVAAPAEAPATAAPEATAPEAPAVAPPAPPPAKAPGFLSFQVAGGTFAFDGENRWVVVPELSRVGFDAKSTLHDFSGVTSAVAGSFRADLDAPEGAMAGEITCDPATLATGVDGRDSNLREHLDTKQFPQIRFEITGFTAAPGSLDTKAQTARGTVQGRMTIRGQTRELSMPVELSVDGSRRLAVKGQAPLKLSDHGVPVPSQLGLISMEDEVQVWVALRARVQRGDRK